MVVKSYVTKSVVGQFGFVGRAILPAAGFQPALAAWKNQTHPLPRFLDEVRAAASRPTQFLPGPDLPTIPAFSSMVRN